MPKTTHRAPLPDGVRFAKTSASSNKKYKVTWPVSKTKTKTVYFGDKRYEHYRDSVPKRLGGGAWSHLDHEDTERRRRYRARHGAMLCKTNPRKRCVDVKWTPSWFSWHYLW